MTMRALPGMRHSFNIVVSVAIAVGSMHPLCAAAFQRDYPDLPRLQLFGRSAKTLTPHCPMLWETSKPT